jgi:hypothetical protein
MVNTYPRSSGMKRIRCRRRRRRIRCRRIRQMAVHNQSTDALYRVESPIAVFYDLVHDTKRALSRQLWGVPREPVTARVRRRARQHAYAKQSHHDALRSVCEEEGGFQALQQESIACRKRFFPRLACRISKKNTTIIRHMCTR